MIQIRNHKQYDLEERCLRFAKRVNEYVRKLPKDIPNFENGRQLVKAGGSVGANYIEANEAMSKKDFKMRIKISKKESKESRYWLYLTEPKEEGQEEKKVLIQEATELMKIFGSILEKSR
jgi:four helix bundle protein